MNKIVLVALIGSFTFLSCKKAPVSSQSAVVENKAVIDFHPTYTNFVYMTTKSKLDYSDGSTNEQAAVTIRSKKDSVIWVSIGKAGVEGVRGLLRPDSVFVIDKLKNNVYSYDLKYLQELTQSNLSYRNIQNLLIGDLVFPYQESTDMVNKNETHYILYQKQDNLHIQSFIRFDNMKVEQANIIDSVAMSKTTVVYSNFTLADSILVPYLCTMDISFNKNNQKVDRKISITHTKVEFPVKSVNFPFNVPKKYNEK